MDQNEFINAYIENLVEALSYEQKEKILVKTQLAAARTKIDQLNSIVEELQQKVTQYESTATTSSRETKTTKTKNSDEF